MKWAAQQAACRAVDGSLAKTRASALVIKAFLLNILNPKLARLQPALLDLLLLSAVFMAMTFVVFVVYGFIAHAFRKLVIESARVQRWLRYSFAAAFAGLGARLALSER